ncbi:sulfite exporter TauE/SafE family protein [Thermoflavimicrobium dichotomicum]|uniref:Probable membrane transporter protein n=1 Tax=Thermoflavimicrobium dichotomicum TaxID=46223 RepID=A0A1I3JNQ4_9BACL|nr:sulfite exporter TauE/SafE family protein [Thermoflavimicrobium dichotomicum]SFI61899.1 hypothetical protein SAMN05421852_101147 [Thermoflavimicrobium dichotomicum]
MQRLIVLALIGFVAQLVDGALGMAYGVTSSSLLLIAGVAPAVASASVHMAEVVTTAASGISHLRFGNVDKQAVVRLVIPGSIGAFLGACFVSYLPGDVVKPYVSTFLLLLGFYVLFRFLMMKRITQEKNESKPLPKKERRFLATLGLVAGFVDSTGGGGWGPLTTPVLLSRKNTEARKVIGTVDTSEFAVAVSATLGFFISLGWEQIRWEWVIALMIGGIIAAPIAAWLVKLMPARILGVLVGGLIVITNLRNIINSFSFIPAGWQSHIYIIFGILWAVAVSYVIMAHLKQSKLKKELPL